MIQLKTLEDTQSFGRRLAACLKASDCITLNGPLGAGKTELARSVIRHRAGEAIDVASPTFSIVESYPFTPPLHHIDLYRLESPDEAYELGLEDLFEGGIVLIEWPGRAQAYLPAIRLDITIEPAANGARTLALVPHGDDWEVRSEALLAAGGAA
jgi:tRNA threonylcarbamoyladenosine biosynthesis protein TsaE